MKAQSALAMCNGFAHDKSILGGVSVVIRPLHSLKERSSSSETRTHTAGDPGTCRNGVCRPHLSLMERSMACQMASADAGQRMRADVSELFCRAWTLFVVGR